MKVNHINFQQKTIQKKMTFKDEDSAKPNFKNAVGAALKTAAVVGTSSVVYPILINEPIIPITTSLAYGIINKKNPLSIVNAPLNITRNITYNAWNDAGYNGLAETLAEKPVEQVAREVIQRISQVRR